MEAPPIKDAVIWKGRQNRLPLAPAAGLVWTIPVHRGEGITLTIDYLPGLTAPLPAGSKAGSLVLTDAEGPLATTDLLTTAPVEEAGLLKRLLHALLMFLRGIKPLAA
jgi:D-alanyl-D-alanine carboxypeptidase (penicillin-binding protein 5/6)